MVDTLLADLKSDADDDEEDLHPGWWSRCIHKLAAKYHWSEERIFALPLVRFVAYSREIDGSDRNGDTELLPEEKELGRLQKLRMELKHGRNQKSADQNPR